jgi:hypothetical protein
VLTNPWRVGEIANIYAAEAKNEKFMRFDVGDDVASEGFSGDEMDALVEDDGEGVSLRWLIYREEIVIPAATANVGWKEAQYNRETQQLSAKLP